MGLKDELEKAVTEIFKSAWTERDGTVVPDEDDIKLGNDAVKLKGTVLYADLAESTALVDGYKDWFSAEIYKTFLHCAAKIIRSENGEITAYDGDRVMAVFIGGSKNTSAVRSAMKINFAVHEIIKPAKAKYYPNNTYTLKHVVGIDTTNLFVARTGIRGANDLVWVGRSANYAAKLSSLPETYSTYITKSVYDQLHKSAKYSSNDEHMWTKLIWNEFDNSAIYGSNWWWQVS